MGTMSGAALPEGVDETPESLAAELLRELRSRADPYNVAGMARYGISAAGALGVPVPVLRNLAASARGHLRRRPAEGHRLASLLWDSGVHEARVLAAFVDDPSLVTREQMDAWAREFDSWDVCDQVTTNLFDRTSHAWRAAKDYSARDEAFVKRCGFVLMAGLAVHDKDPAHDARLVAFLPLIEREASDERNFVKKSVNWALRQIGKRSHALNEAAIATAERILAEPEVPAAARWVARDALRELNDDAVRSRIKR